MKTLNIAKRTSTYNFANTNNSSTIALHGLEEALRLEQQYPTREFCSDVQRARAVFTVLKLRACAGAYQSWYNHGLVQTLNMLSISSTDRQHEVRIAKALGRIVVTHTLPNGYSKTEVGYKALIAALEAIADADREVKREEELVGPKAGKVTDADVAHLRKSPAA